MKITRSHKLFEQSRSMIPGGVNSPVRACRSVGLDPVFIDHADGAHIFDEDGNSYIDYVGSWGPMILGHRHPAVLRAIRSVLKRGTSFGAPTDLEAQLSQMVIDAIPSIDMVRMVNSGTEATMSAVRLARGFTGRDKVIKFDGCYHGHADTLLVEAGSGVATLGIPGSPGVPKDIVKHTISLPFNDIDAVTRMMEKKGKDVACIIVEPVGGNMGLVKPVKEFLEALRELTVKYGSVLIFDEVMTGFRVSYSGAQTVYDIRPDLTCLGKIIGGGMPVGAYGGRKDIMNHIAPQGPVYQAGTLSGNPVAMAAGIATLTEIQKPGFYTKLDQLSELLVKGLDDAAKSAGIDITADKAGSMVGIFFTDIPVKNYEDAKTCNLKRFAAYYKGMRERGIYLAPSQFEALFVSAAHKKKDIEVTIKAAEEVMARLKKIR